MAGLVVGMGLRIHLISSIRYADNTYWWFAY
jgi:hypothetical protein